MKSDPILTERWSWGYKVQIIDHEDYIAAEFDCKDFMAYQQVYGDFLIEAREALAHGETLSIKTTVY